MLQTDFLMCPVRSWTALNVPTKTLQKHVNLFKKPFCCLETERKQEPASVFIFLARVSSSLVPNVCMLLQWDIFLFFQNWDARKSKDVFETHFTNTLFLSFFFSFFGRTKKTHTTQITIGHNDGFFSTYGTHVVRVYKHLTFKYTSFFFFRLLQSNNMALSSEKSYLRYRKKSKWNKGTFFFFVNSFPRYKVMEKPPVHASLLPLYSTI